MATETSMRYFELEAKTLASLQHPNIATLLDAGRADDGSPYLAMELVGREENGSTVSGWRLTEYCNERKLTMLQRLALFVRVCQAVHHAHARGVIHRDLKPSNILVTEVDGTPVPKVIDFGVSKLLRNDESAAEASVAGAIVGTVAYMSPEQASGSRSITIQSDIFALGAILYELLSGFRLVEDHVDPIAHCTALVRGLEFDPPSTKLARSLKAGAEGAARLSEQAEGLGMEPHALELTLRRELEWIPMKAIAHDPADRYASALQLAADVEHYLTGRPLTAGPASRWYRVRKWGTRNKPVLAFASVVLLVAGMSSVLLLRQQAELQRQQINHREQLRRWVVELAGGKLAPASVGADITRKIRDRYDAVLEEAGVSAAQREASVADLERELARIDATQLAGDVMFDVVIAPFVSSLRTADGLNPESRAALAVEVAEKLESVNQWLLAVAVQYQAVDLLEQAVGPNHEHTVNARYHLGRRLIRCGRPADAIRELEQTFQIAEKMGLGEVYAAGVRYMVADAHRRLGNTDAALSDLETNRALLSQAYPAEFANLEGLLLLTQGRYDESMQCFETAAAEAELKSPEFVATVTGNMGLVHLRAGRSNEAELALRKAVDKLVPVLGQSPEVARFRLRLAEALIQQDDFERADQELRICEDQLRTTNVVGGDLNELAGQLRRVVDEASSNAGISHPSLRRPPAAVEPPTSAEER
jgi:non-specific serine/threonine protein kinase/serine/threonine-protein kinase